MLEYAKMIHEALGFEFPRLFMISLGVIGLLGGSSLGWLIDRQYRSKLQKEQATNTSLADGSGGKGGSGNAIGKGSLVVGGRGGLGGSPGSGRGGDGGGGDASGEGSMVIGGDGGGGGRSDGRGGKGAPSPLKRLSPEALKSMGLTGNEGYGQGGGGANSPEYNRRLKVLNILSAEYLSKNPETHMIPMPGVLMPPLSWMNERLSEKRENFRIELIDNGTDFLLRQHLKK